MSRPKATHGRNPRTKASNEWNLKNLERIEISVPKGEKDIIKDAAAALNMSMRAFVIDAIREKIARENANNKNNPEQL